MKPTLAEVLADRINRQMKNHDPQRRLLPPGDYLTKALVVTLWREYGISKIADTTGGVEFECETLAGFNQFQEDVCREYHVGFATADSLALYELSRDSADPTRVAWFDCSQPSEGAMLPSQSIVFILHRNIIHKLALCVERHKGRIAP